MTEGTDQKLRRSMVATDMASGAAKGGVTGAALSALAKHVGIKGVHPGGAAVVGALTGAALGGVKGKERVLKDRAAQERLYKHRDDADERALERTAMRNAMKKSSQDLVALAAFADELAREKVALLSGLGKGMLQVGGKAAKMVGGGKSFGKMVGAGIKNTGSKGNLRRAIGAGGLAVGALGAGVVAGRASK